jgi:glycosyltransferase involved in cell wall biosynthesis
MMNLGVVIIGRNEASDLRSLANILPSYPFDRIVYVDSNSNDESVAVARSACWLVVSLQPDGVLSAPAGRAVGTMFCETEWILYLDGDMQPNFDTLSHCIEYLQECSDTSIAGITGDIVDVYNANSRRVRVQRSMHRGRAKWFGGAVILKRQLVLAAGNWNPNVYANEEIELYARLLKQGGKV